MNLSLPKLAVRLVVLTSAPSVMLIGAGRIGLHGISKTYAAFLRVCQGLAAPMRDVADFRYQLRPNSLDIADALPDPNLEVPAQNTAELGTSVTASAKAWDASMATVLTLDVSRRFKQFFEDRAQFAQQGLHIAMSAPHVNDTTHADCASHRMAARTTQIPSRTLQNPEEQALALTPKRITRLEPLARLVQPRWLLARNMSSALFRV